MNRFTSTTIVWIILALVILGIIASLTFGQSIYAIIPLFLLVLYNVREQRWVKHQHTATQTSALTNLQNQVNVLATHLAATQEKLETLTQDQQAIAASQGSLNEQTKRAITSLQQQLTTLEKELTSTTKKLNTTYQKDAELEDAIASFAQQLLQFEATKNSWQQQQRDLIKLSDRLGESDARVREIQEQTETWKTQLDNISSSQTETETTILKLEKQNKQAIELWQQKFLSWEERLESLQLQQQLKTLQQQLENCVDQEDLETAIAQWQHSKIELQTSTVNTKYTRLESLLSAQQWQEANQEIRQIVFRLAGKQDAKSLPYEALTTLPQTQLAELDRLWRTYSNDRFGFSIQQQIWRDAGGTFDNYRHEIYVEFGNRVGWCQQERWLTISDLLYSSQAPIGHLPCITVGWWGNLWGGGWFTQTLLSLDFS